MPDAPYNVCEPLPCETIALQEIAPALHRGIQRSPNNKPDVPFCKLFTSPLKIASNNSGHASNQGHQIGAATDRLVYLSLFDCASIYREETY